MVVVIPARSDEQIRARFLSKLGIFPSSLPITTIWQTRSNQKEQSGSSHSSITSTTATTSSSSVSSREYQEGLGYSTSFEEETNNCYASFNNGQYEKQQCMDSPRQVQFRPYVIVVEIPSHRDYDKDAHRNMWNSLRVLQQNVKRNVLEFEAEGRNWRTCLEEDDMIRTRNGRLVHPATWNEIHKDLLRRQKRQKKKKKSWESHGGLSTFSHNGIQHRQHLNQANPVPKCRADFELQRIQACENHLINNSPVCVPSLTRFADT